MAASDDRTGAAARGGDWALEYLLGAVETGVAVSAEAQSEFQGTLSLVHGYDRPISDTLDTDYELKSDQSWGQRFRHNSAGATYTVDQVQPVLYRATDAPAQTLTVSIRSAWNGAAVANATATVGSGALGTSRAWVTLNFAGPVALNKNQDYFIRVNSNSTVGKTYVGVHDAGVYGAGDLTNKDGVAENPKDMVFRLNLASAPANGGPTAIALSNSTIAENAGADAVVGILSTTDPDAGDTFTYTLVGGAGSTDNAAFNISGNQLRANAGFDFETRSNYSVRVRTTDQGGLWAEQTFTVAVTDANDAPVLSGGNAFTTIDAVQTANTGDPVSALIAGRASDPDAGSVGGIAVTGVSGAGTWQYSLDGGLTWAAVGGVGAGSARLLRPADRLRFVPSGAATTAAATFRAWDQTAGAAGALADPAANATAFSAASATSALTVLAALEVSSTADSGPGSLRQAILNANAGSGPAVISFNLSAGDPNYDATAGTWAIRPTSPLPQATRAVTVDGTTQPGWAAGAPVVVLSGANAGLAANGLTLGAGSAGSTVRGLVINGFSSSGIAIQADGVTVQGNVIGLDATGTQAAGNLYGVRVMQAANVRIGGTTAAERNVISANTLAGIVAQSPANPGLVIQGNYIGTAGDGSVVPGLGNTEGVWVQTDGATIGGTAPGAGNVISGNTAVGVSLASSSNVVQGNVIGLGATGSQALGGAYGVVAGGANNVIGGTAPGAGNVISGNGVGVLADGPGTVVRGNFIGTNGSGTAAVGNAGDGIQVGADATGTLIGGTAPGAGNVISGNGAAGVLVYGAGTTLHGNLIGLNAAGTAALANNLGVYLSGGTGTVIGGTTAAERNVISGNALDGIWITDTASDNRVTGNYIGTDAAGAAARGNGRHGVAVTNSDTSQNTVGGTAPGAGNVISGNVGAGVHIGDDADGNAVLGNVIGLNAAGTAALPNANGVYVFAAHGNAIGGTAADAGNVISGNAGAGVVVGDGTGNAVQGNRIGTGADGVAAFGNGGPGVRIDDGSPGNRVGGTGAGAGNVVAHNGGAGVLVASSAGNAVLGNAIFANGGLPIDLGGDGPTGNDGMSTAGQANRLTDAPVFTATTLTGGTLSVTGYVGVAPGDADFAGNRVEVFLSAGGPRVLLGFLATAPDGTFTGTLDVTGLGLTATDSIVGTATDGSDNTSEVGAAFGLNNTPTGVALSNATVAENAGPNAVVGTLSAADPDAGDTLTYALVGGTGDADNALFSLVGNQLRANASFDFEAGATYSVRVRTTDQGGLWAEQAFTIAVTDANDAPAVTSAATATAAENQTAAATVTATDPDLPAQPVTFAIAGGADAARFAIDPATGALTFLTAPDFEAPTDADGDNVYLVAVAASDGTATATQLIAVTVTNAPEAPVAADDAFVTPEDAAAVVPVRANDADPDGGALTVTHINGTPVTAGGAGVAVPGGVVALNAAGDLVFTPAANFSGPTNFTYTVGDGGLSASAAVTGTVAAANDAPTDLLLSGGSVAENAPAGAVVGTVTRVDPDGAGDAPTYSLTDSAGGRFVIDPATGALAVAPGVRLDFEAAAAHTVTVRVTDGGGATFERSFTITVTDANEPPALAPVAVVATEAGGVDNAVPGIDPTGDVFASATDPDAGDALTVQGVAAGSVAAASGNVGAPVAGAYGTLRLGTDGRYAYTVDNGHPAVQALAPGATLTDTFTVEVADAGGLSSVAQLVVTARGAGDAPSVPALASGGAVRAGAGPGAVVGRVTAAPADAGDAVTYALADSAGGRFAIDPVSGLVTVAAGAPTVCGCTAAFTLRARAISSSGWVREGALALAVGPAPRAVAPREGLLPVRLSETAAGWYDRDGALARAIPVPAGFGAYELAAVPDRTGDGRDDLLVGAGAGLGSRVALLDGLTGAVLADWSPFSPGFVGGVTVASGDVTGDGTADLVVGAGPGAGPHVKVYDGASLAEVRSFFAFDEPFRGGVAVAAGDMNGDGFADVVVGAGPGAGAHVKAFCGRTWAETRSFYIYDPGFVGGVHVAAGDLTGDGYADILATPGFGGRAHVRVVDGCTNALVASYFADPAPQLGGARLTTSAVDTDGHGAAVLIDTGGRPHLRIVSRPCGQSCRKSLPPRVLCRNNDFWPRDAECLVFLVFCYLDRRSVHTA